MLEFQDPNDVNLADRCIRPICFGAPGNEHYGLSMFELEAGSGVRCRNLMLGLQGSCTLIKYRERYFALLTRHQIAELPNENLQELRARLELLFVLMDDGRDSTNLPINTFLFAFDGNYGDDEDDFVIAVIEEAMTTDFIRAQFFPVGRSLSGRVSDQALCGGFPSNLQQVLMEKDGLRTVAVCKSGTVSSRTSRSSAAVDYPDDGQPLDGMSGGAVFLFRYKPNAKLGTAFVAFIDGIIQRGGKGRLYYLTIERILDKIDEQVFRGCSAQSDGD